MRALTINVDSDGVVYDWHGFMIPFLSERLGVEMTRDTFRQWDLADALGVSKTEFYRQFDEAVLHGCFFDGEPVEGAIEAIETLVDHGHRVRIVTSKILKGVDKTRLAQSQCVDWYAKHDLIDKVEMVFTGSRWGKTGYPADVVIDDKPDLSWAQLHAVNALFDQPWNQKIPWPPDMPELGQRVSRAFIFDHSHVYRAVGWRDVLELIEGMGGGVLIDKGTGGSPVVV